MHVWVSLRMHMHILVHKYTVPNDISYVTNDVITIILFIMSCCLTTHMCLMILYTYPCTSTYIPTHTSLHTHTVTHTSTHTSAYNSTHNSTHTPTHNSTHISSHTSTHSISLVTNHLLSVMISSPENE